MKLIILLLLTTYSYSEVFLSSSEVNSIIEKSTTYPFCFSVLKEEQTRSIHTYCNTESVFEEFRFHNYGLYYYKKQELIYKIPYEKPTIRYK